MRFFIYNENTRMSANKMLDEKLTNKFIFRTVFWGTIIALIVAQLPLLEHGAVLCIVAQRVFEKFWSGKVTGQAETRYTLAINGGAGKLLGGGSQIYIPEVCFMVWQISCDCEERVGIKIDSVEQFQKLKSFFDGQVQKEIFVEEESKQPYYVWKEGKRVKKWFASKWYRCNICGCLWEVNYPDFPARGFVRKFPNGIYRERGF